MGCRNSCSNSNLLSAVWVITLRDYRSKDFYIILNEVLPFTLHKPDSRGNELIRVIFRLEHYTSGWIGIDIFSISVFSVFVGS